jgi:YARHG domain
MQMSFLSRKKSDGLPPWAARDEETLRIDAAMEHLQDHGNLDSFPGRQNEKRALMMTASRQGLVTWNRAARRYELTSLGCERSGLRRALRESNPPMKPPPAPTSAGKRSALGSGTIMAGIAGVVIGAAAMALLPGGSSKQLPRKQPTLAAATMPSGDGNSVKLSEAGNAPPPKQAQMQARAPRQEQASVEQTAPAAAPASPKPEPPKAAEAQQQAAAHPGDAGTMEGALAQQLALAPAAHNLSALNCDQLWQQRNSMFKEAGYCFKTSRAIRVFGNAGCSYSQHDVPLSERDRRLIIEIERVERFRGCPR